MWLRVLKQDSGELPAMVGLATMRASPETIKLVFSVIRIYPEKLNFRHAASYQSLCGTTFQIKIERIVIDARREKLVVLGLVFKKLRP